MQIMGDKKKYSYNNFLLRTPHPSMKTAKNCKNIRRKYYLNKNGILLDDIELTNFLFMKNFFLN